MKELVPNNHINKENIQKNNQNIKALFDLANKGDAESYLPQITNAIETQNYKEAIIGAINLGEDTDTIGALTGGLAGIIFGIDFIPQEWKEKIQRREYLMDIFEEFSENKYE